MHDDAQRARGTHEEYGRPLQDRSRGPQGHGLYEGVHELARERSFLSFVESMSAAEVATPSRVTSLAATISTSLLRGARPCVNCAGRVSSAYTIHPSSRALET